MKVSQLWQMVQQAPSVALLLGVISVGSFGLHVTDVAVAPEPASATPTALVPDGASPGAPFDIRTLTPDVATGFAQLQGFIEHSAEGAPAMRILLPDGQSALVVLDVLTQAELLH